MLVILTTQVIYVSSWYSVRKINLYNSWLNNQSNAQEHHWNTMKCSKCVYCSLWRACSKTASMVCKNKSLDVAGVNFFYMRVIRKKHCFLVVMSFISFLKKLYENLSSIHISFLYSVTFLHIELHLSSISFTYSWTYSHTIQGTSSGQYINYIFRVT